MANRTQRHHQRETSIAPLQIEFFLKENEGTRHHYAVETIELTRVRLRN